MKTIASIGLAMVAGVAHAHESLVPHHHPHATSMLPDSETSGYAVLALALALIVVAQFKRG